MDDNTNIVTAKDIVKNCENSYINSARVLFDSCSQFSYITPQLRNRLKLKTVGTPKISVQTFRNNCSENILEKVNLPILALDGSEICQCQLLCKRNLCTTEQSKHLSCKRKLSSCIILLADSNPNMESLSVDILIKVDYYWSIITQQTFVLMKKS